MEILGTIDYCLQRKRLNCHKARSDDVSPVVAMQLQCVHRINLSPTVNFLLDPFYSTLLPIPGSSGFSPVHSFIRFCRYPYHFLNVVRAVIFPLTYVQYARSSAARNRHQDLQRLLARLLY